MECIKDLKKVKKVIQMKINDVIKILQSRYSCEIRECCGFVHIYYKNLFCDICWYEKPQKFGFGVIYDHNKPIWSTGEFARSDEYTLDQLIYSVLDHYFPIKSQLTLF